MADTTEQQGLETRQEEEVVMPINVQPEEEGATTATQAVDQPAGNHTNTTSRVRDENGGEAEEVVVVVAKEDTPEPAQQNSANKKDRKKKKKEQQREDAIFTSSVETSVTVPPVDVTPSVRDGNNQSHEKKQNNDNRKTATKKLTITPPPEEIAAFVEPPSAAGGSFVSVEPVVNAPPGQVGEGNHNFSGIADKSHQIFFILSVVCAAVISIVAIALYAVEAVPAVQVARSVSAFCAVAVVILTSFLIYLHATAYTNPKQQRLIVRILIMCPIYAVDSFIALAAYKSAPVIGLVRDSYEAYVIYMFFNLLMDFLGGEEHTLQLWSITNPRMKHLFPFEKLLPDFPLNRRTFRIWKFCLLQYMILNPLLTLLSIPLYYAGAYEEGVMSAGNAYVWFSAIMFVSVTFAFTSLVYFFFAIKDHIAAQKPMSKFVAIKTVVFLTFWQSVLLGVLNYFGAIPSSRLWTSGEVSTGLNDFIVSIEMFAIAIAHRWCFSDAIYRPLDGRRPLEKWVLWHMISIEDVLEETEEQLIQPMKNTVETAVKKVRSTPAQTPKSTDGGGYGAIA